MLARYPSGRSSRDEAQLSKVAPLLGEILCAAPLRLDAVAADARSQLSLAPRTRPAASSMLCVAQSESSVSHAVACCRCSPTHDCTWYVDSVRPICASTVVREDAEGGVPVLSIVFDASDPEPTLFHFCNSTDQRALAIAIRGGVSAASGKASASWWDGCAGEPARPVVPATVHSPAQNLLLRCASRFGPFAKCGLGGTDTPRATTSLGELDISVAVTQLWIWAAHDNEMPTLAKHRTLRKYADFCALDRTLRKVLPRTVSALFIELPKPNGYSWQSEFGPTSVNGQISTKAYDLQQYIQVLLLLLRPTGSSAAVPMMGPDMHEVEQIISKAVNRAALTTRVGEDGWSTLRRQGYAILLAFLDITPLGPLETPSPLLVRSQSVREASSSGGSSNENSDSEDLAQHAKRGQKTASRKRHNSIMKMYVKSHTQVVPLSDNIPQHKILLLVYDSPAVLPYDNQWFETEMHYCLGQVFSGYLQKQGVSRSSWKRRFVILKESAVIYQKKEDGGKVRGKRGGVISLAGIPWSFSAEDSEATSKKYCFVIFTPGHSLKLSAESERQRQAWLAALAGLRRGAANEAVKRGVVALFPPDSAATPEQCGKAMATLLRMVQNEIEPLCEPLALKTAVTNALQLLQSHSNTVHRTDSIPPDDTHDLGELEVSPDMIRIDSLLAEGFFGKVYKAEMHGLDVAVKKLKVEGELSMDDPHKLETQLVELRAEVDMLSSLRHPNVVQILGASTRNSANLFIVTEYLTEGSIYNVIHDPTLTDRQTIHMIRQVVLGCTFLHERTPQVIHRDLKPLNLLCSTGGHRVCVGDFGISVRDSAKLDRAQVQGTFAYMAPEVVFGRAPASPASDVFAFGVVLFEWMYIRDHPGDDFNKNDDICYELIHDPLHHGLTPRVPFWWHPIVRQLVLDCLNTDPILRPTFAAVLSRVRALALLCKSKTDEFALRQFSIQALADAVESQNQQHLVRELEGDGVLRGYGNEGCAPRLRLRALDLFLSAVAQHEDPNKLAAAQTEVVEVLQPLLDPRFVAQLCAPGLPWIALTVTCQSPLDADEDSEVVSPYATGLPASVPAPLRLLGGLAGSINRDVARWASEKLTSLPSEQIAQEEHVIRELRRILMRGEVDVEEVTGTQLMSLLAKQFPETLVRQCKAQCETEMVAVMGLLSYGPPSLILEQIGRRPAIYIGSGFNASDRRTLDELNIKVVVNMAPECANYFEGAAGNECIRYYTPAIPLYDELSADIAPAITPALAFIDAVEPGVAVLVHCVEGKSRSVCVVIAMLMRDRGLKYEEAEALVKLKRPTVQPNASFVAQIKAMQMM